MTEPYYEDEQVTLYHGDSLKLVPELFEHGAFDAIITDPPYNEVNRASVTDAHGSTWYGMDKGGADSLPVDAVELTKKLIPMTTGWLIVWCGWGQVSDFLNTMKAEGLGTRLGGWHKASPVPLAASKMWLTAFETCAIGRKSKAYFNGHALSPIWYGEKEHTTVHPTQKPMWLMSEQVRRVVPEGGILLDPFAGSGSTLEAAKLNGVRAVGIEINEEYCEKIADRLSQGVLF